MAYINRTGLEGREEYLGFTLGGVHSSELQVVRVIEDRMSVDLLPPQSNKIVQLPGSDIGVYNGSSSEPREFELIIAYDDMSETSKRRLTRLLGNDKLLDFTLDEDPHKTYYVKVSRQPTLSFIPFDDATQGRVYKGEGSITLVAPDPFGTLTFSSKQELEKKWPKDGLTRAGVEAPQIFEVEGSSSVSLEGVVGNSLETPFKIYFEVLREDGNVTLSNGKESLHLDLSYTSAKTGEIYCLDTRLKLVHSCDKDFQYNGKIINIGIISGDFFNLPPKEFHLYVGFDGVKLLKRNGRVFHFNLRYL